MNAPSVLILGGRGRFGLAAARAFAHAGWRVHAQVRPGASGPAITGVEWLALDPADTGRIAAAACGSVVVVHALNPAYTRAAWRTQQPVLMAAAIAIGRELGATVMLPGNVYNFGAVMPAVLREDTPQSATGVMGRQRIAAEQQLLAATGDGSMRAVVIRAGNFFGSGTGSWLDLAMAKRLPSGRFTYPGEPGVATAWAYLPDLARSFVEVARRRDRLARFATLHFAGHSLTREDWVVAAEALARERHWIGPHEPLRVGAFAWPLLRLLGLAVPTLQALCDMRYLWDTPHALANDRLVALTGQEPRTPLPLALRAALADLGLLEAGAVESGGGGLALR